MAKEPRSRWDDNKIPVLPSVSEGRTGASRVHGGDWLCPVPSPEGISIQGGNGTGLLARGRVTRLPRASSPQWHSSEPFSVPTVLLGTGLSQWRGRAGFSPASGGPRSPLLPSFISLSGNLDKSWNPRPGEGVFDSHGFRWVQESPGPPVPLRRRKGRVAARAGTAESMTVGSSRLSSGWTTAPSSAAVQRRRAVRSWSAAGPSSCRGSPPPSLIGAPVVTVRRQS